MRRDALVVLGLILIILILGFIFFKQGKLTKKIKGTEGINESAVMPQGTRRVESLESRPAVYGRKKRADVDLEKRRHGNLQEFGVLSGFAWGNLKEQDHYEIIPVMLQFGFDLKPALAKIGLRTKGSFGINIEPFLGYVISPNNNLEAGCNFMLKYVFPLTKKFRPYVEGGLGLIYLTQHTREQSTQFNFVDQGGVGFSYLFRKNLSLNLGYRFRHISNASIKHPNSGINNDMILCGVSVLY